MRIYLLPLISFSFAITAKAGDTLRITKPIPISLLDSSKTSDRHVINGKNILFPFTPYNGPFRYLQVKDDKTVEFDNSFLYVYSPYLPRENEAIRSNPLIFGNCDMKYLNLAALNGDVTIVGSKIGVLSYDSAAGGKLLINGSYLKNIAVLTNAKNLSVDCQYTSFADTAVVKVLQSHISGFAFAYDTVGGSMFLFGGDTLAGDITMYASAFDHSKIKDTTSIPNSFYFYDCYIDADFVFFAEIPRSEFHFIGCSFGPHANLSEFPAHKVMFRSCKFSGSAFPIGIFSNVDTAYVSFINTDLDNIRMNFTPNMRIWFDTSDTKDLMENTYVRLIEKFKKEGKSSSLQTVDIQYRQFKDNKILSCTEELWWNYGYNKFRVLWWTGLFVFLFSVFNSIFWNQMRQTYPIIPADNSIYFQSRFHRRIAPIANPLLFTLFIFFSLRIEFDKLNFNRFRWVAFFLIQYAAGIWCLFFIVRAIFTF